MADEVYSKAEKTFVFQIISNWFLCAKPITRFGIIFSMITFVRYSVMLCCWNANPKERPTFEELCAELHQMCTKATVSIK